MERAPWTHALAGLLGVCLIAVGVWIAALGVYQNYDVLGKVMAGFALGWIGLGIGALAGGRHAGEWSRLRRMSPGEPWRWREDWNAGVVRNHAGAKAKGFLWLGIFMVNLSLPAVSRMPFESFSLRWFVLLFPLIGMALAYASLRTLLGPGTLAHSMLRIGAVPLQRGEWLEMHWMLAGAETRGVRREAELRVRVRGRRAGHEYSTEQVAWREHVPLLLEKGQEQVAMRFLLPAEAPPTTGLEDRSAGSVTWELVITEGRREVAYFELPVGEVVPNRSATKVGPPEILRFPVGPRGKVLRIAGCTGVGFGLAIGGVQYGPSDWQWVFIPLSMFLGMVVLGVLGAALETGTELVVDDERLVTRIALGGWWKLKKQFLLKEVAEASAERAGSGLFDVRVLTIYGTTWTLVRDQVEDRARLGAAVIGQRLRGSHRSA